MLVRFVRTMVCSTKLSAPSREESEPSFGTATKEFWDLFRTGGVVLEPGNIHVPRGLIIGFRNNNGAGGQRGSRPGILPVMNFGAAIGKGEGTTSVVKHVREINQAEIHHWQDARTT